MKIDLSLEEDSVLVSFFFSFFFLFFFFLGSKDLTGAMGKAVFDNLALAEPKNHFTVGINDDLAFTSIPIHDEINSVPKTTVQCLLWGLGSDGTVGANKEAIKVFFFLFILFIFF
jgi:hypothetical protein